MSEEALDDFCGEISSIYRSLSREIDYINENEDHFLNRLSRMDVSRIGDALESISATLNSIDKRLERIDRRLVREGEYTDKTVINQLMAINDALNSKA